MVRGWGDERGVDGIREMVRWREKREIERVSVVRGDEKEHLWVKRKPRQPVEMARVIRLSLRCHTMLINAAN